jgi:glycosyltransferase involved in cell wall biosynthesis
MRSPIILVSSYPPRPGGVAAFCQEAREFIQKANPDRGVLVVCHADGAGPGVLPVIEIADRRWWRPVAEKIHELKPYAVHVQHEYELYEYRDERGHGDRNAGFLDLLDAIGDVPTVVEPHAVHGRLTDFEADFLFKLCQRADVVLVKCHYQKWRMEWDFIRRDWSTPRNVMVVPHGVRPDRRYSLADVVALREQLGLDDSPRLSRHLVGLVGWIHSNKRWDILTGMWEEIAATIRQRTGEQWDLLAAGATPEADAPPDRQTNRIKGDLAAIEAPAHYYEFAPRGDLYDQMMAVCDFIVLPAIDETQSGTLARIIALNKPYIAPAPMEGLTAQTLDSEGGLLFTNQDMLKRHVIELACNEPVRLRLGENLRRYLDQVVSWDVVAGQYGQAYELARRAQRTGKRVELAGEGR